MQKTVLTALSSPLQMLEQRQLTANSSELIIRLKAAALNRRDYWITQGQYPGIELPAVLGSDGAGEVTSVGQGVDPAWIGKPVIINPSYDWGANPAAQGSAFSILGMPRHGTLATEIAVPASQVHARPAHLDWLTAAALPLAGLTAYRALVTKARATDKDTLLITGIGGGVAAFALQFAQAMGIKTLVTSSSADKRQRALSMGAAAAYDYRDPDWHKRLQNEHGSFTVAIDGAGGAGYEQLIESAAPGARIVNYGATAGLSASVNLFTLFWKQLQLLGTTMGTPDDFVQMVQFVEKHRIVPVVDEVFALDAINDAIERIGKAEQFGKIVIRIP